MESLKRLVKTVRQTCQRAASELVASTVRFLSDTSRMHFIVVHGEDVFGALCSLEECDSKGMQRAMRFYEIETPSVPVRTRVFGEYALTLSVLEWPLHPSEETTSSLVAVLLEMVAVAANSQRPIDGITLVANEFAISRDRYFYSCFVKAFNQLNLVGCRPLAILQHCDESCTTPSLPFDVLRVGGDFIKAENLHRLLSRKVDPK